MADFSLFFPKLMLIEGGYSDNPADGGGPTKYGITLDTWKLNGYDKNGDGIIDKEDVKLISPEDAESVAKKLYWDKIKGDEIRSQSVAELFFDWAFNSGVSIASKEVQKIVGVVDDGIIGPKTLAAINIQFSKDLFSLIKESRKDFLFLIVFNDSSQKIFLKGWLSRVRSFIYVS